MHEGQREDRSGGARARPPGPLSLPTAPRAVARNPGNAAPTRARAATRPIQSVRTTRVNVEADTKRSRGLLWLLVLSMLIKLAIVPLVVGMEQKADERQYVAAAPTIVATGAPRYPNPNWDEAHAAPGMPYFLAGCYALAGESGFKTLARVVQVLLSVFTLLLVHALALRLGAGPRTALLATALVALDPTQIAFTHYFWAESLYSFLSIWAVWLLVSAADGERNYGAAFGAGLVAGVATLTRGLLFGLTPLIVLWLLFAGAASPGRRVGSATLFVLGLVLAIAPWSLRNTERYGKFLLVSTNVGAVLAKGANPITPENHDLGLGGWSTELREYTRLHGPDYRDVIPMRPRYISEDIVEQNDVRTREGLAFLLDYPALTLRNARIRLQYLVNPTSFLIRHIREGYYGELPRWFSEPVIALTLLASMVVMAGFVFGVFVARNDPDKMLTLIVVVGSLAICALVAAVSRYRVPLVPLMAPYAALALTRVADVKREVRRAPFWLLGAPVLVFLAVVWVMYLPLNYR